MLVGVGNILYKDVMSEPGFLMVQCMIGFLKRSVYAVSEQTSKN